MTRLDRLSEIAEHSLGGLKADTALLARIRQTAAQERPAARRPTWRAALAWGLAVVCLCAGLWLAVPQLLNPLRTEEASSTLLGSKAAGGPAVVVDAPVVQPTDASVGTISVGGSGTGNADYRNLFAAEKSGNFPVLLLDNAAYRMLLSPTSLDRALLGESLGEVSEYTLEPALSSGGVVSNIVNAGTAVYAVRDMTGAMVAATVQGNLRVFQRVSFAGKSVLGQETLKDTLAPAQNVIAMELTGLGVIDDPDAAQALMQTLLDNATFQSASVGADDTRSLLLALDNGLLMQLMVGQDTVSACGTWSCPEFFEAYAQAAAEK